MKIKCIENRIKSVPTEIQKCLSPISPLKIGKEYTVYAISEFYNYTWYCITNETYCGYPFWHPFMFFEISDAKLSRYWIYAIAEDFDKKVPFLSFSEWANDQYFYDSMIENNGNGNEIEIFSKYKAAMDLEFPDHSILDKAEIADDNWLMCPYCIDAWENSNTMDAMVICPTCKRVFHNPRYKDEWPHLPL